MIHLGRTRQGVLYIGNDQNSECLNQQGNTLIGSTV